jgi:hypothetical protein
VNFAILNDMCVPRSPVYWNHVIEPRSKVVQRTPIESLPSPDLLYNGDLDLGMTKGRIAASDSAETIESGNKMRETCSRASSRVLSAQRIPLVRQGIRQNPMCQKSAFPQ